MKLERGFRRLAIVLSVAFLAIGIALDALLMHPHATLEVILKDGRSFVLERHTTKEYLTDWQGMARDLASGRGVYEGSREAHPNHVPSAVPSPGWVSAEDASRMIWIIVERREAHYQWWTDADWTKAAAVLVALLWITFYTVRWIVRGFTGS